jgi:hypothetical protein
VFSNLNCHKAENAVVDHIESRPSKKRSNSSYEIYLEISCDFPKLIRIINRLKSFELFPDVIILGSDIESPKTEGLFKFFAVNC